MSDREVKTKQTFEEWWGPNRGAEYDWAKRGWNAALASVIIPEGRFEVGDRVKVRVHAHTLAIGEIVEGIPKTVDLTTEEKLNALFDKLHGDNPQALAWHTISVNLANGKTLDQLCSEFGVSTTKESHT